MPPHSVYQGRSALPVPPQQPSPAPSAVIADTARPDGAPALPSTAAVRAVQGVPTAGLQLVAPSATTSSPYETLKNLFAEANDPIAFADLEAVDARQRTQRCVHTRKTPERLTAFNVWSATVRPGKQDGQGHGPLFPPQREPRQYVGYGDRALAKEVKYDSVKVVTTPSEITTELRNSATETTPYSISSIRKKGDLLAVTFKQPTYSADQVFGYCWREPTPAPSGG